jgi:tRNA pseudouridine55 synthase
MTAKPSQPERFHGILVVDKPAGWTSHDVVGRIRRLLGERHVGHAGTLDPAATGVLPLAVGDATKVIEYLSDAAKTYLAEITFGVETDSHDADGRVIRVVPSHELRKAEVERALTSQRGEIEQVPPMHCALKIGGKRLYELARAGLEIDRRPRRVTIFDLRLIAWQPPVATLLIDCSKGTYVRSIARDLGITVGVGAYLSNLVRIRTGPFSLDDAWTLPELAARDCAAEWESIAIHPDEVLIERPVLLLDERASVIWRHGGMLPANFGSDDVVRVYDGEGTWLGIGRCDVERRVWRPRKVVGVAA